MPVLEAARTQTTYALPAPQLGPGIVDVADLWAIDDESPVCVGLCNCGAESRLARYLYAADVPYYFPQERLVRWVEGDEGRVQKVTARPILPGFVTVGGGWRGRDTLNRFARQHNVGRRYLDIHRAQQRIYRDELVRFAPLVDDGVVRRPDDDAVIQPGRLCRVVDGPYMGMCGEYVTNGTQGRFVIVLSVLGQRVPTSIPIEHLEIV